MKTADRNCGWSALGSLDAGENSPKRLSIIEMIKLYEGGNLRVDKL